MVWFITLFRTAVSRWGQITWNLSGVSPKRDWSCRRFKPFAHLVNLVSECFQCPGEVHLKIIKERNRKGQRKSEMTNISTCYKHGTVVIYSWDRRSDTYSFQAVLTVNPDGFRLYIHRNVRRPELNARPRLAQHPRHLNDLVK